MPRISASLRSVRAGTRSYTSSRPVSASGAWKGTERFSLRTLCLRSHLRSSRYFLIISTSLVDRSLRYHVVCPLATADEAEYSRIPVPCPRSRYPQGSILRNVRNECRTELSISDRCELHGPIDSGPIHDATVIASSSSRNRFISLIRLFHRIVRQGAECLLRYSSLAVNAVPADRLVDSTSTKSSTTPFTEAR